jgi:hypothetical protein
MFPPHKALARASVKCNKLKSSNPEFSDFDKLAILKLAERDVEFAPISGSNWENRHLV